MSSTSSMSRSSRGTRYVCVYVCVCMCVCLCVQVYMCVYVCRFVLGPKWSPMTTLLTTHQLNTHTHSSPKRMRPISQDLDTSIEHEEATRRARGMAGVGGVGGGAEPGSSHGTLKTPPHQICVARHRVREALDNSASKKPQEKRPRMSI